jgi:hypothetical protein
VVLDDDAVLLVWPTRESRLDDPDDGEAARPGAGRAGGVSCRTDAVAG